VENNASAADFVTTWEKLSDPLSHFHITISKQRWACVGWILKGSKPLNHHVGIYIAILATLTF